MEGIQTVKMEFPDCYWDLSHAVPCSDVYQPPLLEAHSYSLKMVIWFVSEARAGGFLGAGGRAGSMGVIRGCPVFPPLVSFCSPFDSVLRRNWRDIKQVLGHSVLLRLATRRKKGTNEFVFVECTWIRDHATFRDKQTKYLTDATKDQGRAPWKPLSLWMPYLDFRFSTTE